MNKLSVILATITEGGVPIDAVVSATDIRPAGADEFPLTAVHVGGVLSRVGKEYLFKGTVSGAYLRICDRCLVDVECPLDISAVWAFAQGPGHAAQDRGLDDDEDVPEQPYVSTFEGNTLNLGPRIWEEVVLASPSKALCSEDCAGLCQSCGANLNAGPCGCGGEDDEQSEGLAGLKKLFPELGSKQLEE